MTEQEVRSFLAQFDRSREEIKTWPKWMQDAAVERAATFPKPPTSGVRVDAMSQTLTVAELAKRSGVKSLTVMERIKEWGGGDVTLNQPINLIGLATAALAHGMEGRKP